MKQKIITLFKNFGIFVIAFLLFVILFPIGIVWDFLKSPIDAWSKLFYKMALCIDETGNVILAVPLNSTCIIKGGYMFGDEREKISGVLGKNLEAGKLTKFGLWLNNALCKVQGKTHTIDAIDTAIIDVVKTGIDY